MPSELAKSATNILNIVEQVKSYRNQIDILKKTSPTLEQKQKIAKRKLNIRILLDNLDKEKDIIFNLADLQTIKKAEIKTIPLPKPQIVLPKPRVELPQIKEIETIKEEIKIDSKTFGALDKKAKKQFIQELSLDSQQIDDFLERQKKKLKGQTQIKKEDYTIYKPSPLGQFANKYFKKQADKIIAKYPNFFAPMFKHFTMVEMEMLSRSYVSIMLLFTLISPFALFITFLLLNIAFKLRIITIILIAIIGTALTFFAFYFYPGSLMGEKSKKIKLELPFALVHMSAVAGSGAQPTSIFELVAESEEYPELKKEIKKVLNYVNLFGYNLTTALKAVSKTTPSPELRELLEGMVSTIETGGDTRDYLKEKAADALNTYKLERRKQVEALSTYSEVYTSLLIAAPLLLMVTLAIMNAITGTIVGLDIQLVAWIGTIIVMPLLNVGFMLFINSSQKGT